MFDSYARKKSKSDCLSFLHIVLCTLCFLLAAYCLSLCISSFMCSLQDLDKYGALGSPYPLHHYLDKNDFWVHMRLFLWVTAEFGIYIILSCNISEEKNLAMRILYFGAVAALHVGLWIHANSLPIPNYPPYSTDELPLVGYRFRINKTILPSIAYFTLYFFRVFKIKYQKNI